MLRKEEGFSLIELLVVVTIIGILAAVATTTYVGVQLKAARSEAYTNLSMLRLLQEQFFAEQGTYAGPAVNTVAVQALLPRFQPGTGAKFNYAITSVANGVGLPTPVSVPYNGVTAALADPNQRCYIATATGITGKVAEIPDLFAIDCNNLRNFE